MDVCYDTVSLDLSWCLVFLFTNMTVGHVVVCCGLSVYMWRVFAVSANFFLKGCFEFCFLEKEDAQ